MAKGWVCCGYGRSGGGGVRRTWRWRDALGDLKEAFSVALEIWWVIQLLLGELVVIFFMFFIATGKD